MANIARWDPFEDSIDDLMRGLWLRPARLDKQEPLRLKVDVREDPKAYTRPWKIQYNFSRILDPNFEHMEFACIEGEVDMGKH